MSNMRPPQNPADENAQQHDHPQCAKMEEKFNKRIYGGISYAGQAIAGIIATHWIRHGSGRPIFDKMANWLGPNFISKIKPSKQGIEAVKEADSWIVVGTMINFGNAFIPPVKWLEDRKPQIIRNMNARANAKREANGEVVTQEERAHQEAHLAALEAEPKQTWWSMIKGRVVSLAAVTLTLRAIGTPRNQAMETMTANAVKGALGTAGLKAAAQSHTVENYARIAFYDSFYSAVSAGSLFAYTHLVDPPKTHAAETPQTQAAALSTPEPSAPPPVAQQAEPQRAEEQPAAKAGCKTGRCPLTSREALLAAAKGSYRERVSARNETPGEMQIS